jgi:hypothetical protein
MSSIPIETFNQVQAAYIIVIVAGFASALIIGLLWFFKNMMRSKSGKKIDSVKTGHKQLLVSVTPGHRANLFKVNQFIPGILETAKWEERISKKRKTFHEPERTDVLLTMNDLVGIDNLSEEQKKQALALSQECLTHMLSSNTEKVYLEDGVPMTIALEDKVITTGVKGIGALAFYEKLHKIDGLKEKIDLLKGSTAFKDVGMYLQNLLAQVSLINIDVLRNYFDSDWNQNDEESQNEYHFTMGYRKGKKGEKGFEKWLIIAGLVVMGIGVGALVAAIMLVKK